MKLRNCRTRSTDYYKIQQNSVMSFTPKSHFSKTYVLIKYGDTRLLEVFIGLFSLIWGVYMLFPIDSFSNTSIFIYLSQIIPEWFLGVVLILVGLCTTLFATSDNCSKRRMSLLLNHLAWMFLFAFAAMGNYASPAICTYGFFAGSLMYLFLKSPASKS